MGSIKNPEEPLYNREQTIVEVDVQPYTHSGPIAKQASKVEGKKPIKSSKEEKKTKIPIGKPLGLDLEVSVKTEEEHFEITRALKDLKASALSLLAGSPVPSYASRRTSVRVTMNPRDSETKEADLYLTVGTGSRRNKREEPRVYLIKESKSAEIEQICSEYAPENKEDCKREIEEEIESPDSDVKDMCQERKEKEKEKFQQQQQSQQQCQQQQQMVRQQHQQQQQQQQQQRQQQQEQQQKQQQQQQQLDDQEKRCNTERQLIKSERKRCVEKLQSKGSNRRTAEDICDKKAIKSEKRHEARQQIKKVLRDVEEGTVVSASYNLVLSGTKSRNIEGSITVGEKIAKLGEEETKVELRMYVNTP